MDSIEIKGYKSIESVRIDLRPINILIGANGSGKSNFISFFTFLNRLYNKKLSEYVELSGGANKILHNGIKKTKEISFKVEFERGGNGYSSTLAAGEEGFVFTDERLTSNSDKWVNICKYTKEAYIKDTDNLRAKYVIKYLNGFRKYHFHDTSINSAFTNMSHIENDIYFLYGDGSNLAAFLYKIKKTNKLAYNKIVKTIQSIAPYFSDFYLQPNSKKYIRLQWSDKFSETIYGPTDLSDGTIRFIALTALLMQPDLPDTIIIDEPELGLHPKAIAKLSGMIKSVTAKGSQVIVATQSADLIGHFDPEDIIVVDQFDGKSDFKRLDSTELSLWLENYTIDDLWKRSIIPTGQPGFR